MTDTGYEWRHGWIPLTLHAAILKAHGNHDRAEQLLAEGRARRPEFTTPLHQAAAAQQAHRQLRALSDDQLADAVGATDDDARLDVLLAELDRRDKAAAKAAADRARRARRREHRDAARDAAYERRVAAGDDPEAAYAAAYGLTAERVRRDAAIGHLRSAGYRGKGLAELTRAAFADHVDIAHQAAEDECRGQLLTAEGLRLEAAGKLRPRDLFTGPEARARKYASPELLDFWQAHGRLTVEDYAGGILGGHMRHTAGAWA